MKVVCSVQDGFDYLMISLFLRFLPRVDLQGRKGGAMSLSADVRILETVATDLCSSYVLMSSLSTGVMALCYRRQSSSGIDSARLLVSVSITKPRTTWNGTES